MNGKKVDDTGRVPVRPVAPSGARLKSAPHVAAAQQAVQAKVAAGPRPGLAPHVAAAQNRPALQPKAVNPPHPRLAPHVAAAVQPKNVVKPNAPAPHAPASAQRCAKPVPQRPAHGGAVQALLTHWGAPNLTDTPPVGWQAGGGLRTAAAGLPSNAGSKPDPWPTTKTALLRLLGTRQGEFGNLLVRCRGCGEWTPEGAVELEHLVPWENFRAYDRTREDDVLNINDLDNLTLMCAGCNKSKGTMHISDFMAAMHSASWPAFAGGRELRFVEGTTGWRTVLEDFWAGRGVPMASGLSKANAS